MVGHPDKAKRHSDNRRREQQFVMEGEDRCSLTKVDM
jgi:hypothetical protein